MKQQFFRAESFSKSFSFGSFVIRSSSIIFPNEKQYSSKSTSSSTTGENQKRRAVHLSKYLIPISKQPSRIH